MRLPTDPFTRKTPESAERNPTATRTVPLYPVMLSSALHFRFRKTWPSLDSESGGRFCVGDLAENISREQGTLVSVHVLSQLCLCHCFDLLSSACVSVSAVPCGRGREL
ncbi:hypothetical protein BaRGS_00012432 [Batillaria attramentaria]|uniref:Uncharacterized protein n=1 Tax=Batillaria attramentaria TaxID=370345 RepID=A0ABD0LA50_9CAEN